MKQELEEFVKLCDQINNPSIHSHSAMYMEWLLPKLAESYSELKKSGLENEANSCLDSKIAELKDKYASEKMINAMAIATTLAAPISIATCMLAAGKVEILPLGIMTTLFAAVGYACYKSRQSISSEAEQKIAEIESCKTGGKNEPGK